MTRAAKRGRPRSRVGVVFDDVAREFHLEKYMHFCMHKSMEPLYRCTKADELHLTPLELIERIAALVPPPRTHRHRYFGVLAPNSPLRAAVTALATPAQPTKQVVVQADPATTATRVRFQLMIRRYSFRIGLFLHPSAWRPKEPLNKSNFNRFNGRNSLIYMERPSQKMSFSDHP